MTGTLVTLRPINVQSVSGWTAAGTGPPANVAAATNDDSDLTYGSATVAGATVILNMTSGSVPATAQVRYVIPRYRAECTPSSAMAWIRLRYGGVDDTAQTMAMGQVPTSGSGTPRTVAPGNVALDPSVVGGLEVKVQVADMLSATEVRLFELYLDVFYNEAPVVAVTGPASTPATTQPTVTFTYTDPELDAQERYRVVVYETSAISLPGFVIGEGGTGFAWDSGVVFSAVTSVVIGLPLKAGVAYTAYVQAADAGSGGRFSAWAASGSFTPTISEPPATPSLTAAADPATGRVVLDVTGRNNLLGLEDSTFATTSGNWFPGPNCASAVRSTTHAVEGAASLRLTSTAAGQMSAFVGATAYALVEPARVYTVLVNIYAPTGETAHLHVDWRDAATIVINGVDGLAFKTVTGQFQQIRLVTTSPAGANTLAPWVYSNPTAGGEQHWVDVASIVTGYVNLLADNQSAFETGSGGLTGTNCTIDNPAGVAPFQQGDRVARLTVTADGDAIISTPTGLSAFSAAVGSTFGVLARFRAENAAAARTVSGYAEFFDIAGSSLGVSAVASGSAFTADFTDLAIAVTAPANTATVCFHGKVASAKAGETWRADCLGLIPLIPGATTVPPWVPPPAWTAGGMAAISTASVERSVDRGTTWTALRGGSAVPVGVQAQEVVLYDYEAPLGVPTYYRVQGAASVGGMALTSGRSANVAATLTPGDCDGWLKDPTDPTRNMTVRLPSGLTSKKVTTEFVSKPVGRDTFVVLGDTGSGGDVYSLTFAFQDDAEYAAFEVLRASRRTLLLQTGFGDGTDAYEQAYVRLSELVSVTRVIQDRTQGLAYRTVTIDAYSADPPA